MSDQNGVVVRYGLSRIPENADFVGKTVTEIRSMIAGSLNVPSDAAAIVNGSRVSNDYRTTAGEEILFIKESGSKG